jgi:hypothetical protein
VIDVNAQRKHQGHEYVDLGLSVKWATCNVGANSSEGYGDYYAWGETSDKSSYTRDNCTTSEKSIDDIKGTSHDVAHIKWGGNWRMPTKAEFDELSDANNCTWTWTTQNGKNGFKVTSKKNGNSIFLPAAGKYWEEKLDSEGSACSYWSSTPGSAHLAYAFVCFGRVKKTMSQGRAPGLTVRPVLE